MSEKRIGKIFEWLDRLPGEEVGAYDNRINSLAAFHAGYAFFSSVNYYASLDGFAVYAVWNSELNGKLEAPLPSGGFMLHCDRAQAEEFLRCAEGFPVFLRLKSKLGRLYAEHLVLSDREKLFDLYYNGCDVIPPGITCFLPVQIPADPHFNEGGPAEDRTPVADGRSAGGSFPLRGSYRFGRYGRGSYRKGSYIRGSFRFGSLYRGSYRGGSFRYFGTGSYFFGGFGLGETGSFRSLGRGSYLSSVLGSYRFTGFSMTGSYRFGSYRGGSFRYAFWGGGFASAAGSFYKGSFRLFGGSGSFRQPMFNGSYYGGSYHRGSYVYGGCADPVRLSEEESYTEFFCLPGEDSAVFLRGDIPIRRLTFEMGYGLDLI